MLARHSCRSFRRWPVARLGRRHYGAAPAVMASDPRKDKTVHLTHSRGVNVIHDPLLSKGTIEKSHQSTGSLCNPLFLSCVF